MSSNKKKKHKPTDQQKISISYEALPSENIKDQLSKIVENIEKEFFWSSSINEGVESVFYTNGIIGLTGYTQHEIKSLPNRGMDLIYEEDLNGVKDNFEAFLNDSARRNIKLIYRLVRKDKNLIWVKESITVDRDEKGTVKNFYGIVSDITDLKSVEETARKSEEELRLINFSKDKFISILSHDLRSPFTSILGFSEILINEPNLSEAEKLEYLNYIHDSSKNQLQLVNYLLDWSKIQTGKLILQPQKINAQDIVYNSVSALTGNAVRKHLDIKVEIKDSLYIKADLRLLTMIITNLLSNAIKFSYEDKIIKITAGVFNDELIEFIVRDEGIGISEKNKSRLFQIDEMFSTEGTKGEKGTGLGLSLTKEIVERHKGQIWFYSEQGKGSEFHFTIPASKNTVLLVDNEKDRLFYEKIIKKDYPTFEILGAGNGYEAMNIVYNDLPSLIITEHEMPLMNGIQFIESVRSIDKNLRVPFIAVVSNLTEEIRNIYYKMGIYSILQKPVDIKLFCEKLQSVLHN